MGKIVWQGGKAVMMPVAAAVGLASEDAEAGPVMRNGKRILEAWHGSPHKFDKFDMSKIGTGEGAQAYGHGLYFADAEDVARGYKERLQNIGGNTDSDVIGRVLEAVNGDTDAAVAELRRRGNVHMEGAGGDPSEARRFYQMAMKVQGGYDPRGALYRTEIDIDPDTLLDWDKPLSEQPQNVREALLPDIRDLHLDATSGQNLYSELSRVYGGHDAASAAMRERGIPGIRYRDGMTRGKYTARTYYKGEPYSNPVDFQTEQQARDWIAEKEAEGFTASLDEGSYNYVMFDDAPIRIVERGAASPEAMLATALAGAGGLYAQKRAQERGRLEQTRQKLAEMYSANLAPLSPEQRAGYHGTIQPPNHPNVEWIAQALDKFNRRLEGSPAQLLNFEATAPWLRKLSYGQDPSAMETLGASMEWMP